MEQFDFWKGTEDSVFNSEVASALESLGDLEAEAAEKRRREDLQLASEVESSPFHTGLAEFGEFDGGAVELESYGYGEVAFEAPEDEELELELELGSLESRVSFTPHGEIELEAPENEELELEASAEEVTAFLGELEAKTDEELEASAPEGACKSCGQVVQGMKRDFCSYGCTKRAAFVGLPLKFPRTDKPRGRRGQP